MFNNVSYKYLRNVQQLIVFVIIFVVGTTRSALGEIDPIQFHFPDAVPHTQNFVAERLYYDAYEPMKLVADRVKPLDNELYTSIKSKFTDIIKNFPDDPINLYCKRRLIILDWMADYKSGTEAVDSMLNLAEQQNSHQDVFETKAYAATMAFRDGSIKKGESIFQELNPIDTSQFGWFAFESCKYYADYVTLPLNNPGTPNDEKYARLTEFVNFLDTNLLPKMESFTSLPVDSDLTGLERDQLITVYRRMLQDMSVTNSAPFYRDISERCTDSLMPRALSAWEDTLPLLQTEDCFESIEASIDRIVMYRDRKIPRLVKIREGLEFGKEFNELTQKQAIAQNQPELLQNIKIPNDTDLSVNDENHLSNLESVQMNQAKIAQNNGSKNIHLVLLAALTLGILSATIIFIIWKVRNNNYDSPSTD